MRRGKALVHKIVDDSTLSVEQLVDPSHCVQCTTVPPIGILLRLQIHLEADGQSFGDIEAEGVEGWLDEPAQAGP